MHELNGKPGAPDLAQRGRALAAQLRHEEALALFDRALGRDTRDARTHYERGLSLQALNRFDEAIESHRRALALEPRALSPRMQIGVASLCLGDFDSGWRELEWRWHSTPELVAFRAGLSGAQWGGEARPGTRILLHAEQGFGDTIQFARYAPLVAARGMRVVLHVEPALGPLLGALAGVEQVAVRGEPTPPYDCYCPLLSLPLAFATRPDSVPARLPYLAAPRDRLERWRARLGSRRAPRVGIAWRGRSAHHRLDHRALTLEEIMPLLGLRQIEWVVLQKARTRQEAAWLGAQPALRDVGTELADFADTAAIAELLDLVVSVDTSVAHLAGALGRPLWVLLPFSRDWRWLERDGASLWYPGARLFRQAAPRDWASVIEQVRGALAEWAR